MIKKIFSELNAFYPAYLRAHNNIGNQVLHFIGSTLFFTMFILSFILQNYWLIGVAIFAGYLLPGIGHRFFEHNKSFRTTKPALCVLCAFRLYIDTLSFRIRRKMKLAFLKEKE